MNRKIVMSHVGARGQGIGSLQMPIVQAFAEDVDNVLFEADEDCVASIEKWWNANGRCSTSVLPHCLWREDGQIDFRVNLRGTTSSVFPLNERFRGHYYPSRRNDYVLGEAAATVETRRLNVRSLDSLVASGEAPCPDLLGLDTQGSEFEILSGAADSIRGRMVAVVTEFAFDEVYRGQKTFADLHTLMLGFGFSLAQIKTQKYGSFRGPLGARGRIEPLFGDALYLRRIDVAPESHAAVALYKLAAIAAALGHVEYALAALARADDQADASLGAALGGCRYFSFLRALSATLAAMDCTYLPSPASPRPAQDRGPRSMRSVRARFGRRGHSPLERVFVDYGLEDVAARMKRRRLLHESSVAI